MADYSDDVTPPFTLDIDGETSSAASGGRGILSLRDQALIACSKLKEVKVTNKDGLVIFHSLGTKVLYPIPIGRFWKDIVK